MRKIISPNLKSIILFCFSIVFVLSITTLIYLQYGFNGYLLRDDAIYLYSGQQMSNGIPPYVSIFDHKGPITPMIVALGVMFSNLINSNDVYTVRILFFCISVFTVVCLFLFTLELFSSSYKIGILTSFVFVNFWGFGKHAASGPQGKTPLVLFEIISLWLTNRKMWFFASFFGSLAFLTWQPTIIYPVITIILSVIQSKGSKDRAINVFKAISGAITPIFFISLYFFHKEVFKNFVDGFILFNGTHLTRIKEISILANIKAIFREITISYTTMSIPMLFGLTTILILFLLRLNLYENNISKWISKDRFAALFLSFPVIFIWSLIDFQWYDDLYVFLPYAAIGSGLLLNHTIENTWEFKHQKIPLKTIIYIISCCFLILIAMSNYRLTAIQQLYNFESQVKWAEEIEKKYGSSVKILSINVPEALVILHKTNPNPFIFINEGIDQYINEKTPGGINAWLMEIKQYEPDLIFYRQGKGIFMPRIEYWLDNQYEKTMLGTWTIYTLRNKSNNPIPITVN